MTWSPIDRAGLLDASGDDPYVELTCGDVAVGVVGEHGWACLHRWRPSGHWGGAAIVHEDAPDDAESTALAALLEAVPEAAWSGSPPPTVDTRGFPGSSADATTQTSRASPDGGSACCGSACWTVPPS